MSNLGLVFFYVFFFFFSARRAAKEAKDAPAQPAPVSTLLVFQMNKS